MERAGPFGPSGWMSRERPADGLLAAVVAALGVASVLIDDPLVAYDYPEPNAWLVLLALGGTLPLALRRRFPLTVLAAIIAAVATIAALRWNAGTVPTGVAFALYAVAAWRTRWPAVTGLVMVYALMGALALVEAPYFDSWLALVSGACFTVVWVFGRGMRKWRRGRETAQARALTAERARVMAAERAVFGERIRIAREMHDVVSHTLAVIAVQSGTTRHVLDARPELVGPALNTIEQASRDALDELRAMLGVLKPEEGGGHASFEPSPGLAELRRVAKTPGIELGAHPDVESQPDSLRLIVYRVVQEGVTNAHKHSPGAAIRISVRVADGAVDILIDNDAPPAGATAAEPHRDDGFGLVGMGERVAMFGGELRACPRADGGFRVHAVLRGAGDPVAAGPVDATPLTFDAPQSGVREGVVDVLLAVALAPIVLSGAFIEDHSVAYRYPEPTATLILLLLACCFPLALRRRWPIGVFAFTTVAATAVAWLGWNSDWAFFCTLVALYTVAAWRPARFSIACAVSWHAVFAVLAAVDAATFDPIRLLDPGGLLAWTVGVIVRRWRREQREALARTLEAERDRATEIQRAVFAERLRVAAEMHDVISHTLSAIAVQAASARHLHETRPGSAGAALKAIERASRGALNDLRRMLGVLRAEEFTEDAARPALATSRR